MKGERETYLSVREMLCNMLLKQQLAPCSIAKVVKVIIILPRHQCKGEKEKETVGGLGLQGRNIKLSLAFMPLKMSFLSNIA